MKGKKGIGRGKKKIKYTLLGGSPKDNARSYLWGGKVPAKTGKKKQRGNGKDRGTARSELIGKGVRKNKFLQKRNVTEKFEKKKGENLEKEKEYTKKRKISKHWIL